MKSLRRCEIVSNLKKGDEILFDMENLKKVLIEKNNIIKDFCYIIHDKDTYTEIDEKNNPEHKAGSLKPAHIHLLLRFKDNQPQKLNYIAKWFGIKENFVNKINGSWEDACLYQIHANSEDKYQYDSDEVIANFDYEEFLTKQEEKEPPIKKVVKRILSGEIREYNKTLEIDNMLLVTFSKTINEAFKVRSEFLQATSKERHTEVIYICGLAGSGKTTLAKKIATEKGMDYFISSGSNDIMDGYAQEPCLIVDDIRPSVLGLSDLLKMLDNHSASSIKSRYKNKYLNCELIILTTIMNINTFYKNVFSEHDEPINQLKRRCGTYIEMDRENIYISIWDNKTMRYTNPVMYKNNIIDQYIEEKKKTKEDTRKHVAELIPFLELEDDEVIDTENFHLEQLHTPNELSKTVFQETVTDEQYNTLLKADTLNIRKGND